MENNYNANDLATPNQKSAMVKMGYQGNDLDKMTKAYASQWISEHKTSSTPQQENTYPNSNQYNAGNTMPYGNPQPQAQTQPQYTDRQYQTQSIRANVPTTNDLSVILKDNKLGDALASKFDELVSNGELFIPENYSVGNALRSAISKIMTSDQAAKLMACTTESKQQALMEYVVQGLDASKTQCYFIPYGDKMVMMRSYMGDVSVCKRTGLVSEIYANVIYAGDEIEIGHDEFGMETLVNHKTSFLNRDNDIVGAYACAITKEGRKMYCFMTINEIKTSWQMSKTQGGKFLTSFKQEAAKRTVIRRLVKMIFNTSLNTTEEQTSLIGSYNRTTEDEYDNSNNTDSAIKSVNEHQRNTMGTVEVPRYVEEQQFDTNAESSAMDEYDI